MPGSGPARRGNIPQQLKHALALCIKPARSFWELGLSALGTFGTALLCFSLSYQARMGFTAEQADRTRHPDVAESLG